MLPCELTNHSGVAAIRLVVATLVRVRVDMTIRVVVPTTRATDHLRFTKARCQRPVFRVALWKESVDCLNLPAQKILDFPDFVGQVLES